METMLRFLHLLAASVWIGGMVTMAAVAPALRRAGASVEQVRRAARGFGVVAWTALGVSVLTGIGQIIVHEIQTEANTALLVKLLLVALAASAAWAHQAFGRTWSARVRGSVNGLLLLTGLGILWSAIQL